jgi:hypothetical protein
LRLRLCDLAAHVLEEVLCKTLGCHCGGNSRVRSNCGVSSGVWLRGSWLCEKNIDVDYEAWRVGKVLPRGLVGFVRGLSSGCACPPQPYENRAHFQDIKSIKSSPFLAVCVLL